MLATFKKLCKIAGITVLVLAASLLAVKFIRRTFFPKPAPAMAMARLKPGAKISLPEVRRTGAQHTLIIYLNKSCRFCEASAPFYRRLVQETSGLKGVQLLALLPHELEDSRTYLSDLGLSGVEVRQSEHAQFGTLPTPTLLLVDNQGVISRMWVGQQRNEGESNILLNLRAGARTPAERDAKWSRWEN